MVAYQRRGGAAGGRGAPARLRSEGSQSSGGKAMRQKSGDGSVNSTPISVLPPSFCPTNVTVQGSSSTVFLFISEISSPRATGFVIRRLQPCALTDTV